MDEAGRIGVCKDARDAFKRRGLRITPQRSVIYSELSGAKDHPSAGVLYRRVRRVLPDISFDTVYRALAAFSGAGLVRMVEGYGEDARYEPDMTSHHHMRCLKCRKITDFENDIYSGIEVPPEIEKNFRVVNKRVVLEGICDSCENGR